MEFLIDLVSSAAPIAKAPYQLALPEMQELSTQIHELLDRGLSVGAVPHGELQSCS